MKPRNDERYEQILSFIKTYVEYYSRSPIVREIANHMDLALSTVQFYIDRVIQEKKIERANGNRGIILAQDNISKVSIPLVGAVACGTPIYAEENVEDYIAMSRNILGNGEFYALRAKGDSMINVGINSGDIVIIRKQNCANVGDIIVALIDNVATLKCFYKDDAKQKVILRAANPNYDDMHFDDILIQGKAVKS